MVKDNNFIKESSSIIEEIESQLQDVLEKRKKAVEEELEEKIRQAQEEANKRKSELESQLKNEQDALINYKNVLSEFESSKDSVKAEIKTHLDIAIKLQTEIEEKTALSLDELGQLSSGVPHESLGKVKIFVDANDFLFFFKHGEEISDLLYVAPGLGEHLFHGRWRVSAANDHVQQLFLDTLLLVLEPDFV